MLRERRSDIALFVEHPVYSIIKMWSVLILVDLFWLAIIFPNCMCKSYIFDILGGLGRRQLYCSFLEHPAYSFSKMYSSLILVFFYFNLPLLIQSTCVKVTFLTFRCSTKEAVILLRLSSTMYTVFSKCKMSWI